MASQLSDLRSVIMGHIAAILGTGKALDHINVKEQGLHASVLIHGGDPEIEAANEMLRSYTVAIFVLGADWDSVMQAVEHIGALWLDNAYPVVAVSTTNDTLSIDGDRRHAFPAGRVFSVSGSTGNDGNWTVESVAYSSQAGRTTITVTGNITNATVDGTVKTTYFAALQAAGAYDYIVDKQDPPVQQLAGMSKYVGYVGATLRLPALT